MKIHVNVTGSGKKHVDESYVRGKKKIIIIIIKKKIAQALMMETCQA